VVRWICLPLPVRFQEISGKLISDEKYQLVSLIYPLSRRQKLGSGRGKDVLERSSITSAIKARGVPARLPLRLGPHTPHHLGLVRRSSRVVQKQWREQPVSMARVDAEPVAIEAKSEEEPS
jgi:hypothetical protein